MHLILTIPIYVAKHRVNKNKIVKETKKMQQSYRLSSMINFGGLKTAWVCLIPFAFQVILLYKIDKMTPDMLKEFPNYWLIYFTHMGNEIALCIPLVALCYSKRNIRRAFKDWLFQNIVEPLATSLHGESK